MINFEVKKLTLCPELRKSEFDIKIFINDIKKSYEINEIRGVARGEN